MVITTSIHDIVFEIVDHRNTDHKQMLLLENTNPSSRSRTSDLRISTRVSYSPPLFQLSYRRVRSKL
uniref:Uncharacterized protein n=1 Tax=Anguilla anguilla TaxID=7936 RepID=A0A0E9SI83_ANGAN